MLAQARDNLAAVQANLGRQYPKTDAMKSVSIEPLKEATVGGVRKSLWLLFASVSLLLLIACTNIAALLLSRAALRQHETSVRFSLGASRASVAAQLFTEVLILAMAGARPACCSRPELRTFFAHWRKTCRESKKSGSMERS